MKQLLILPFACVPALAAACQCVALAPAQQVASASSVRIGQLVAARVRTDPPDARGIAWPYVEGAFRIATEIHQGDQRKVADAIAPLVAR